MKIDENIRSCGLNNISQPEQLARLSVEQSTKTVGRGFSPVC